MKTLEKESNLIKKMLCKGQIEQACRAYIDICQKHKVDKLPDLDEMTLEVAHLMIFSMTALKLTDDPWQESVVETGSAVIFIKRNNNDMLYKKDTKARHLHLVK